MTKLKAMSVLQCRDYVLETHGQDGIERVKAAMNPAARNAIYADDLVPTDWVEVWHGVDHARAYDRVFGIGDGDMAWRLVIEITARHATTLYRSVLVGALARSPRLWPRYYNQGESHVEFPSDTTALKRVVGCPDLPRYHDWLSSPYYAAVLQHSGARDVAVKHIKCVATGADCCETELRWKLDRSLGSPFEP
jgi:hypothetical protein